MKLVALVATLFALIIPTSGLAAADVQTHRSCSWNGYEGIAVTVERDNGGLLVCRVFVPWQHQPVIGVFPYKL